jgi:transcription antitermination factor NusG
MAEITREEGEKIVPMFNFKVGENVEVVSGELAKHFGKLIEIREKVGVIRCRNKEMKDSILT